MRESLSTTQDTVETRVRTTRVSVNCVCSPTRRDLGEFWTNRSLYSTYTVQNKRIRIYGISLTTWQNSQIKPLFAPDQFWPSRPSAPALALAPALVLSLALALAFALARAFAPARNVILALARDTAAALALALDYARATSSITMPIPTALSVSAAASSQLVYSLRITSKTY